MVFKSLISLQGKMNEFGLLQKADEIRQREKETANQNNWRSRDLSFHMRNRGISDSKALPIKRFGVEKIKLEIISPIKFPIIQKLK